MQPNGPVTIIQAVGFYVGSFKAQDTYDSLHRELFKFVNWCGPERLLSAINPSEIGEYAEQVGGTGTTPQAAERLQVVREFLVYARKKGLIDKNLAQHVRIRKSRSRHIGVHVQEIAERIELTPDGHAQLIAQLEQLKSERAPLAVQIQKAAADKDVRENVPLEAAREQLGHVESRIREIENTLKAAVVMDSSRQEKGQTVKLGMRVHVKDLTTNRETSYMLVGRTETNPLEGKISDVSPLGRALVNRSVGQEVEVETPRGKTRYRILKVSV